MASSKSGPAVTLHAAEEAIDSLVSKLDVPVGGRSLAQVLGLGLARQAAIIHRAIRREAMAEPTGASALVLLRTLVEMAIIIRWLEDDPDLRARAYLAEDDRVRLGKVEPFTQFRSRRTGRRQPPAINAAERAAMKARVAAMRTALAKAKWHVSEDGPLLPSIELMATMTRDSAMWEAYNVIYRIASSWVHAEGLSLTGHGLDERPGGVHLMIGPVYGVDAIRSLAAPSMAHLIGSASRICALGLEAEARVWQDAVVLAPVDG